MILCPLVSVFKSRWYFFNSEKCFTLVSNMQILRFNLIMYNSHNWAASSTLISPDAIILYRALTCSSVAHRFSCRSPTFCSIVALYGSTLGTYDGIELISPEGSTEGTTGGNLETLLLGAWIGYLDGLELGTNVGNELGLYYGKVLGTTLGALGELSLGTYDYKVLIYLEGSTEGIAQGNFEGLLIGNWLGSLDELGIDTDDGNALWLWYGKTIGTTLGDMYGLPLGTYDFTELVWP